MTDRTCNGWKNHATWLVSLWLDEDGFNESMIPDSRCDATQTIKDWVDDIIADQSSTTGLAADLIASALSDVDWYKLADKYIEMRNNEEEDSEVQD